MLARHLLPKVSFEDVGYVFFEQKPDGKQTPQQGAPSGGKKSLYDK